MFLGQKVKVQGHTIAAEAHSTRRYRRVPQHSTLPSSATFSSFLLLCGHPDITTAGFARNGWIPELPEPGPNKVWYIPRNFYLFFSMLANVTCVMLVYFSSSIVNFRVVFQLKTAAFVYGQYYLLFVVILCICTDLFHHTLVLYPSRLDFMGFDLALVVFFYFWFFISMK